MPESLHKNSTGFGDQVNEFMQGNQKRWPVQGKKRAFYYERIHCMVIRGQKEH
jgi:hypothetical protein